MIPRSLNKRRGCEFPFPAPPLLNPFSRTTRWIEARTPGTWQARCAYCRPSTSSPARPSPPERAALSSPRPAARCVSVRARPAGAEGRFGAVATVSRRSAAGSTLREDVEPFLSALYRVSGRHIARPTAISIDSPVADYAASLKAGCR